MFAKTLNAIQKHTGPIGFWGRRGLLKQAEREMEEQLREVPADESCVDYIQRLFLEYRNVTLHIEGM